MRKMAPFTIQIRYPSRTIACFICYEKWVQRENQVSSSTSLPEGSKWAHLFLRRFTRHGLLGLLCLGTLREVGRAINVLDHNYGSICRLNQELPQLDVRFHFRELQVVEVVLEEIRDRRNHAWFPRPRRPVKEITPLPRLPCPLVKVFPLCKVQQVLLDLVLQFRLHCKRVERWRMLERNALPQSLFVSAAAHINENSTVSSLDWTCLSNLFAVGQADLDTDRYGFKQDENRYYKTDSNYTSTSGGAWSPFSSDRIYSKPSRVSSCQFDAIHQVLMPHSEQWRMYPPWCQSFASSFLVYDQAWLWILLR